MSVFSLQVSGKDKQRQRSIICMLIATQCILFHPVIGSCIYQEYKTKTCCLIKSIAKCLDIPIKMLIGLFERSLVCVTFVVSWFLAYMWINTKTRSRLSRNKIRYTHLEFDLVYTEGQKLSFWPNLSSIDLSSSKLTHSYWRMIEHLYFVISDKYIHKSAINIIKTMYKLIKNIKCFWIKNDMSHYGVQVIHM